MSEAKEPKVLRLTSGRVIDEQMGNLIIGLVIAGLPFPELTRMSKDELKFWSDRFLAFQEMARSRR